MQEASALKDAVAPFAAMPPLQRLFIGLAAFTWLIGGNVLFALNRRRLGKSFWRNPFASPTKDFNRRERLMFAALLIATMCFGMLGVSLGQ